MPRKARDMLITIDEMAGLSQVIVVDANCDGLKPAILAISKKTDVRDVKEITGMSSPLDAEIHDALQDLGIGQLVFVTKNCGHFINVKEKWRAEATYYLICVVHESAPDETIAKDIVFMLRHDVELKGKRMRGTYPVRYLTQNYMKDLKNDAKSRRKGKMRRR